MGDDPSPTIMRGLPHNVELTATQCARRLAGLPPHRTETPARSTVRSTSSQRCVRRRSQSAKVRSAECQLLSTRGDQAARLDAAAFRSREGPVTRRDPMEIGSEMSGMGLVREQVSVS